MAVCVGPFRGVGVGVWVTMAAGGGGKRRGTEDGGRGVERVAEKQEFEADNLSSWETDSKHCAL